MGCVGGGACHLSSLEGPCAGRPAEEHPSARPFWQGPQDQEWRVKIEDRVTLRSEGGGWPCSVTGSFRVGQCPKPKSGPLCIPPNRFQPIRHDALRLRILCFSGKGKAGQHPPLWVCTEWGRAGLSSSLCSCFGLRVAGLPDSLLPRKHSHWIWCSR